MLFKRNNEINSEESKINNYKKYIIIGFIVILLIAAIILIIKSFNRKEYQEISEKNTYDIKLNGNSEITIYQGDNYVEPGYTATDNYGRDVSNEVVTTGNFNSNVIGKYLINYIIHDKIVTRQVNVIVRGRTATDIHLLGNVNIYLNLGDKYIEPGYVVVDSVDGDITSKVEVTNNLNTNKIGVYKVVYTVTNSIGITTIATRNIIVIDSDINLMLVSEDITNKNVGINVYVSDVYYNYLILPNGNKTSERNYVYNVNENGTYKFTVYNKMGSSKSKSIEVKNIDRTKPSGSCNGTYTKGLSNVIITASDASGISKYVIDGNSYTTNNITINKEMSSVTVTIYDKAGNSSNVSCGLKYIASANTTRTTTTTRKVTTTTTKTTTKKPTNPSLNVSSGFIDTDIYYLYVPKNATESMPMIVVVPPSGPNATVLKEIFTNWPLEPIPAFVFISRRYSNGIGLRNSIIADIDNIVSQYKIDKKRISLTGFSSSGTYIYYLAAEHKGYFSAMIPVSSGVGANHRALTDNLEYFKNLPMKGYSENGKPQVDKNGKTCDAVFGGYPEVIMSGAFKLMGRPEAYTNLGKVCHSDAPVIMFYLDENNDGKSDNVVWMINQKLS